MFGNVAWLGSTLPLGSEGQSFALELVLTAIQMFVILCVSTGPKEVGVMAGIAVMMWSDFGADRSFIGGLIAFAIAVALAGTVVIVRRWPHIRMTPATCTGAAVAMVVSYPLTGSLWVTGHDFALLAFFGAGQLGVGMILLVTGARLIPAVLSSLLGMLEPILGPAWVWIFLGEEPGATTLAGGALVMASVAAYTISMTRRRTPR
jgi:drug/metabolite transporter (DMT)-like permease